MGVPLPGRAIPEALVKLYYTIDALRPAGENLVLQLVAAGAGQGTSTIAGMLARTAAARDQSVLLLDCGHRERPASFAAGPGPSSIAEAFRAGLPLPQAATAPAADGPYRLAALAPRPHTLLDLPTTGWRAIFAALRGGFDMVLLDSPAAAVAPEAAALARYCDGTILVVQAEATTAQAVQDLRRDIERAGGRIVGAVLNRERSHLPGWLSRRL